MKSEAEQTGVILHLILQIKISEKEISFRDISPVLIIWHQIHIQTTNCGASIVVKREKSSYLETKCFTLFSPKKNVAVQ